MKINGERHYLGRAVDQEGEVLEAFVSKKRDRKAALKFLRKLMKRYSRRLSNRFSVISSRACREELLHLFFPAGQVQVLPVG